MSQVNSSAVETAVHEAIVEANEMNSDLEVEVWITPEGEVKHGTNTRGSWDGSDDIHVCSIDSWSLSDDGLDISVEELEAMSDEERKEAVECNADAWVGQFRGQIDEALEKFGESEE